MTAMSRDRKEVTSDGRWKGQRPLHGRRCRRGGRLLHQVVGFKSGHNASPAFAEVLWGNLRLLLAGPESSAGRPMPDGRKPEPGGWNRIHFVVEDIEAEVERLRGA